MRRKINGLIILFFAAGKDVLAHTGLHTSEERISNLIATGIVLLFVLGMVLVPKFILKRRNSQ